MVKKKKKGADIFWRIFISLIGVVIITLAINEMGLLLFGKTTQATDVSTSRNYGSDSSQSPEQQYIWSVSWEFTVDGKEYKGSTVARGSAMSVKHGTRVYYYSFAPYINSLYAEEHVGFGTIVSIGIGMVLIIVMNKGKKKKNKSRRKNMFCRNCGKELSLSAKFCSGCGIEINKTEKNNDSKNKKIDTVKKDIEQIPLAEPDKRDKEKVQEEVKYEVEKKAHEEVMGKVVKKEAVSKLSFGIFFMGIKSRFTDKRSLIAVLITLLIWIGLPIVRSFGIWNNTLDTISNITYTFNGLGFGTFGKIGNVLIKGAGLSIILSLFGQGKPFSGVKNRINTITTSIKGLKPMFILGMGITMVLYNLMVGKTNVYSMMGGVFLAVSSIQGGGLLNSIIHLIVKKSSPLNEIKGGFTAGYAFITLISILSFDYCGYFVGSILISASTIIFFIGKNKKEVSV